MGKTKRANGEGTVRKYETGRKKGTWYGAFYLDGDTLPDGRPRRSWVYGRTQAEVRSKIEERKAEWAKPRQPVQDKVTVERWLADWINTKLSSGKVSDSTVTSYRGLIKTHIVPCLGTKLVSELTPSILADFLGKLAAENVSAYNRRHIFVVLSQALDQAVKLNLIVANGIKGLDKPSVPKKYIQPLTEDEVKRLLQAVHGDRFYALYRLALNTGMRQGELFGLEWSMVDFANGTIKVFQALKEVGSRVYMGIPKSDKSRRVLSVSPATMAVLQDHKDKMAAEGHGSHLVFCSTTGGVLRKGNFMKRHFYPTLEKASLRRVRFHDLRHTFASHMIHRSANPVELSEMMGHSSVAFTLDTYCHIFQEARVTAARRLDDLFADA